MHQPPTLRLLVNRLATSRLLLLSLFVGITLAATLSAAAPMYIRSLEQLAFSTSLQRIPGSSLPIYLFGSKIALKEESLSNAERSIDTAVKDTIAEIYLDREVYLKSETFLVGLPEQQLPPRGVSTGFVSRGYFQYLSNLESRVRFLEGRMASDIVATSQDISVLEAVIGAPAAKNFGLTVGDIVTLTPHLADSARLSVQITGILEPADKDDNYWSIAGFFFDPAPLMEEPPRGVEIDPDEPPLPLFIKHRTIIDGIGQIYDGSMVQPFWFMQISKDVMKQWSPAESKYRLGEFGSEINNSLPGSSLATGVILSLINDLERKIFFSRVPVLLLVTILIVTVLFFILMALSYLIQGRERDISLMKNRGMGTAQVAKLYALEGLLITVVATGIAPFLAIGSVALAGKSPYLNNLTGGQLLLVELEKTSFMAAAGTGTLCLVAILLLGILGSRTGLLTYKLRSSRPPSIPMFHRYYLDVGLLAIGGITFWELQSRGQLISGGLFGEAQINEVLLLTPILFLIAIALVFMRIFPLLVRYIAGESLSLLHLVATLSILTLPPLVALKGMRETDEFGWLATATLPLVVGASYWLTIRVDHPLRKLAGLAIQTILIWGFVSTETLMFGDIQFIPSAALISLVPFQIVYILLVRSTRAMPAWTSLTLWHMARNPLQYSWLVLLLVLITGVAILSTTVGGTLQKSQEDRIMYDVPTDIRVTGLSNLWIDSPQSLKETYLNKPGVSAASVGLRDSGHMGPVGFEILGMEPAEFPHMSWFRNDFSVEPLPTIMKALQSENYLQTIELPANATSIGIWAKPQAAYIDMSMWMVLQDGKGTTKTITLGKIDNLKWQLFKTAVPSNLEHPLKLVSVQVFVPSHTSSRSDGTLFLDAIHVTLNSGAELLLEDFETDNGWAPIITSALSSDTLTLSAGEVIRGKKAGIFSFGTDMTNGIRGIYHNPTASSVPIIASSSFVKSTGIKIGQPLVIEVDGSWIPVVIKDTIHYFPTLNPAKGGFILIELESLLKYLNIMKPTSPIGPNEIFLTGTPEGREALLHDIGEQIRVLGTIHDRRTILELVQLNPLASAGWQVLVLLSLGIVVLTGTFGYATYLLLFAARSKAEVGFLQSIGFSRTQLIGLLAFEHLTIVAMGIAVGTWSGIQMSRLMVTSLAVTENGEKVIPPFILATDWGLMTAAYGSLIGIFFILLIALSRSIGRPDLQSIAKVADY